MDLTGIPCPENKRKQDSMVETKTKIRFGHRKKMILGVCGLISVWLVMTVYAEDKKHNQNQNVPSPSAVSPETNRSANVIKTIFYPELTKHELKIEAALNTEMECDFSKTPLSKVMKLLADRYGITILVLKDEIREEGVSVEEPVSLSVKGISLRNVLGLILEPHGLTYMVDQDVLQITSQVKADEIYKLHVYPVDDFGDTPESYLELIHTIQTAVLDFGDEITVNHSSKSLVIRPTYHKHMAIVELLTQLRQERALE